jgi:hypothetical protein
MQRTWILLAVAAALAGGAAAAGSGSDDLAAPRSAFRRQAEALAFRRQAGALLSLQGLSLCEAQNHSLSTVIVLFLRTLNCGFACCSSLRSTGATHSLRGSEGVAETDNGAPHSRKLYEPNG